MSLMTLRVNISQLSRANLACLLSSKQENNCAVSSLHPLGDVDILGTRVFG